MDQINSQQQKPYTDEKALHLRALENEALLLSVLNASPDIIQVFDAVRDNEGTIVDFKWRFQNKRGAQQNGDVIGKSLLQVNPGAVASGIFGQMILVADSGIASEKEEQYYYREQFEAQWFCQSIVKNNDGVVMTTRDITAQKKVLLEPQASKSRLEAIINVSAIGLLKLVSVRDGIGAIRDFRCEWLNEAAILMGFDVCGKSFIRHFPVDIATRLFNMMVKAQANGTMEEAEIQYKSGEEDIWHYFKIVQLDDGVVVSCDDTTTLRRSEQALSDQAHLIKAVTDEVPDMISVEELPSRDIIYANYKTKVTLGWDEGKPYSYTERMHLCHPEDVPALEAFYLRFSLLADEEENRTEYRLKSKNGYWLLVDVRGRVFKRDSTGNVKQVLMIAQNITENRRTEKQVLELKDRIAQNAQEQLKQSETLLASVFKASPIGLGFFNTLGEAVLLNDEMRRFLPEGSMPSKDDRSVNRWIAYDPNGNRVERNNYPGARALRGDPILPFLEMQYLQENGDHIWARVSAVPFADDDGNILGFISVITDINELKKNAEELKQSEQRLMQLLKQKDDFISIASHELRTPVTSIKAYTQLTQANLEKAGDKRNADLLSRLNGQINRLINLINQLLDSTRIQEGKLELNITEMNILDLLVERIEEIQPTTTSNLILKHGDVPLIMADRERIGQVINNLLSNAIKYSAPGSQIIAGAEAVDNGVRVSVQDQGEGISEKDQRKVFDRFYRNTDSNRYQASGMGLGLFISSEIVERHGGSFNLESTKGKGSVFSFVIPCQHSK